MAVPGADRGAIAFAEKVLALLDRGAFTSTYKYAVLLGLIDLALEGVTRTDAAPTSVTTAQLARDVLELYWSQTAPYEPARQIVLRQNQRSGTGTGAGGQAEILQRILDFRHRHAPDPSAPLARTAAAAPGAFATLVDLIEWKLVEMPLPRLQTFGRTEDRFIYEIGWGRDIRKGTFNDKQSFQNTILFVGNAADHLVRLAGLLRPLIQRQWAQMIAQLNADVIPDARLEAFLFGVDRIDLGSVRSPLRELQDNRCFYCGKVLGDAVHVDHFIPWARYPNNGLGNLVVADARCNGAKREFLASAEHVERWTGWVGDHRDDYAAIASRAAWEHHPARTLGVARAIYLRLPEDALLWRTGRDFVRVERGRITRALTAP